MIECDQCNVVYGARPTSCPLDNCPLMKPAEPQAPKPKLRPEGDISAKPKLGRRPVSASRKLPFPKSVRDILQRQADRLGITIKELIADSVRQDAEIAEEPMPEVTIEPTSIIPEVYMWEVVFRLRNLHGERKVKKRFRTPDAHDAIKMAEEDTTREKGWVGLLEHTTVRLVDAYRDDDYNEIECHRDGCGVRFRGPAVYCSLRCTIDDR